MKSRLLLAATAAALAISGCGSGESRAQQRANELVSPNLKHAAERERKEEAEGKAALKEREAREQREKGAQALEEKREEEGQ